LPQNDSDLLEILAVPRVNRFHPSAVSLLKNIGAPEAVVMQIAGHESASISRITSGRALAARSPTITTFVPVFN